LKFAEICVYTQSIFLGIYDRTLSLLWILTEYEFSLLD